MKAEVGVKRVQAQDHRRSCHPQNLGDPRSRVCPTASEGARLSAPDLELPASRRTDGNYVRFKQPVCGALWRLPRKLTATEGLLVAQVWALRGHEKPQLSLWGGFPLAWGLV